MYTHAIQTMHVCRGSMKSTIYVGGVCKNKIKCVGGASRIFFLPPEYLKWNSLDLLRDVRADVFMFLKR